MALLPGETDDEILLGYLDLVRTWRSPATTASTATRFRQVDLVALVGILGTDPQEIERRLIAMTGCTPATATRFRRLLLAGVAAVPVGLAALALTMQAVATTTPAVPEVRLATSTASSTAVEAEPQSVAPRETAIVVNAIAVPAVPLTEVSTPAPTPDSAPAPTVVQSPVPDPAPTPAPVAVVDPRVEANVSIPTLGIDLPVVLGGQSIIDEGIVAHYTAPGWREPVAAGAVGTYWLAAHHVTYGGPFRAVSDITIGTQVHVRTPTGTFTYTVSSLEVVLEDAGFGPVYGADPAARVILLQTCLDSTRRLLVHGSLTATS